MSPVIDLDALRASREFDRKVYLWKRVSDTFLEGAHCKLCPHSVRSIESSGEKLRRCTVLDHDSHLAPDECPGVATQKECAYCRGHGQVWKSAYGEGEWQEPCQFCNGTGVER